MIKRIGKVEIRQTKLETQQKPTNNIDHNEEGQFDENAHSGRVVSVGISDSNRISKPTSCKKTFLQHSDEALFGEMKYFFKKKCIINN